MLKRYACLIWLIQLWGTKIYIFLFLSSLMLRKVDNLQKFRSQRDEIFLCILIFLVFAQSDIPYLWQGEISMYKVLVPIKVVSGKNDYFCYQKFDLHR